MSTAPFDPAVAQLITQTHEQTFSADVFIGAEVHDLDVEDWSIMLDEARSPRVDAELRIPVPDPGSPLDLMLDPRKLCRTRITIGYRLPSGEYDKHQLFQLHLRDRRDNMPDGSTLLTFASSEALLIDASPAAQFYEGVLLYDSCLAYITQQLQALVAGTPLDPLTIAATVPAGPEFTYDAFPSDFWSGIIDAADAIDASVYDIGDEVIRIEPRKYLTSQATLTLKDGTNGTVVTSEPSIDRDQFWNAVTILWVWSNRANTALPDRVWGTTSVTSGPYTPALAGYRSFAEQRSGQVSATIAQRVAVTVQRRLLARARTCQLTAISAWWLRPEDTVTVQLRNGTQERHLVRSVQFNKGGTMDVVTRLPDNQSQLA